MIHHGNAHEEERQCGDGVNQHRRESVPLHDVDPAVRSFVPGLVICFGAGVFRIAFFDAPVRVSDEFGRSDPDDSESCQRRRKRLFQFPIGKTGRGDAGFGKERHQAGKDLARAHGKFRFELQCHDVADRYKREADDQKGRDILNEAVPAANQQNNRRDGNGDGPVFVVPGPGRECCFNGRFLCL